MNVYTDIKPRDFIKMASQFGYQRVLDGLWNQLTINI